MNRMYVGPKEGQEEETKEVEGGAQEGAGEATQEEGQGDLVD